jgi:hypothetical protein
MTEGPSTILTQIYLDGMATGVASTIRTYANGGSEMSEAAVDEVVNWFMDNVVHDEGAMEIVLGRIAARIEGKDVEKVEPLNYTVKTDVSQDDLQ